MAGVTTASVVQYRSRTDWKKNKVGLASKSTQSKMGIYKKKPRKLEAAGVILTTLPPIADRSIQVYVGVGGQSSTEIRHSASRRSSALASQLRHLIFIICLMRY